MESQSINNTKGIFQSFAAGTAVSKTTGDFSFKTVWNNQTGGNKTAEYKQSDNNLSKNPQKLHQSNDQVKDSLKVKNSENKLESEEEVKSFEEEDFNAAMEILNTAAGEFFIQVADELDLTQQELTNLMDKLGMEALDLLQPEKLTGLVLAASGEEDMISLLTNEQMYQTMQKLQNQLSEVMQQAGEELQLPKQEVTKILQTLQTAQESLEETNTKQMPQITIEAAEEPNQEKEFGEAEKEDQLTFEETDNFGENSKVKNELSGFEKTSSHEKEHSHADTNAERGHSTFVQNLLNRMEQISQPQTEQVLSSQEASPESIIKQILDYMKIQLKPDMSNVEMQLHPENLGTLHIQLSTKLGAVTAEFITQNESVKAALESQIVQLQESFQQQGIKVEAIEVTVQTHQFEQNLEQGNHHQQQAEEKKSRVRRINLNFSAGIEEDFTQEEQLAAKIMEANGSVVDYTV